MQIPDFYDAFRQTYSAWLDIQAIRLSKFEQCLELLTTPPALHINSGSNDPTPSVSEAIVDVWENSPSSRWRSNLPLRRLCPVCFGGEPRASLAVLSFDGNFQHKRFDRGPSLADSDRDSFDNRLFVVPRKDDPLLEVFAIQQ